MKLTGWLPAGIMKKVDLGSWISEKRALLRGSTDFPAIELNAIASHFLQKPTSWIVAHPEATLTVDQIKVMDGAILRLLAGEPLAYITGVRPFFGLDFLVDQRVLIPRPETELLVEQAIRWLEEHPGRRNAADIGTGSGAIAISLASHFSDLKITAVDISPAALEVAQKNACLHQVDKQIHFIQSDLLENVDGKYDIVLANLPYIPAQSLENLESLRYEPRSALDGGADGMALITKLIDTLPAKLAPEGCAIFEIQYNQHIAVKGLASRRFPQGKISVLEDLASLPRIVKIQI